MTNGSNTKDTSKMISKMDKEQSIYRTENLLEAASKKISPTDGGNLEMLEEKL